MSTRGLFGFIKDNKIKALYIPNDAYPKGFGHSILERLSTMTHAQIVNFYEKKLVFDENAPESELITAWDLIENNWTTRGKIFKASDWAAVPIDTMFCEYSYLYCFKTKILKCYKHGLSDHYANIKLPIKNVTVALKSLLEQHEKWENG